MKPLDHKKREHTTEVREDGRVCTQCRVFKPWSEYSRVIHTTTGYRSNCRDCHSRKVKKVSDGEG